MDDYRQIDKIKKSSRSACDPASRRATRLEDSGPRLRRAPPRVIVTPARRQVIQIDRARAARRPDAPPTADKSTGQRTIRMTVDVCRAVNIDVCDTASIVLPRIAMKPVITFGAGRLPTLARHIAVARRRIWVAAYIRRPLPHPATAVFAADI